MLPNPAGRTCRQETATAQIGDMHEKNRQPRRGIGREVKGQKPDNQQGIAGCEHQDVFTRPVAVPEEQEQRGENQRNRRIYQPHYLLLHGTVPLAGRTYPTFVNCGLRRPALTAAVQSVSPSPWIGPFLVGENADDLRPYRHVLTQLDRIDLVQSIVRRVVQIEIAGAVLLQIDDRPALIAADVDIRPAACDNRAIGNAKARDRGSQLCMKIRIAMRGNCFRSARCGRPRNRFPADTDLLVDMRLAIGGGAVKPDFLCTCHQDANRTQRLAGVRDMQRGGGDDTAPCPVVESARSIPPAVDMTRDQNRRERGIASDNLAHHIATGGDAKMFRCERQLHDDRTTICPVEHALQIGRIGKAQRTGRRRHGPSDIGRAIGVAEGRSANMRIAMIVRADRFDDRRNRALVLRNASADPAGRPCKSILRAILRRRHRVRDIGDLAGQAAFRRSNQGRDILELDDFCSNTIRACGGAAAQGLDHQRLRKRAENLCLVQIAGHPGFHLERLVRDIGEPAFASAN